MSKKDKFILTVMGLSIILLLWILPNGHDLWYHLYRIGAMAVELEKSPWNIPIRILSDTFNGYGYGAALYYGDIFLYIPAVLVVCGMNIVMAYKIFSVMMWLGCFGISYYTGKILGGKKENCLLLAYMYTFSASFILNVFVRSAVGEALAMIFLPLVFGSYFCLLYKEQTKYKFVVLLALSMTAIALSHMISLMWTAVILIIWSLMEWKRVFNRRKWIEIIKAALLMTCLSASFLFPMLEQMIYQKVQTAGNHDHEKSVFMEYGIEWIDYFISYDMRRVLMSLSETGENIGTWRPGTIGLFAILLVSCIVFFKITLSKKTCIILIISLTGLISLAIDPVMNLAKEVIAFTQFSWRILPFLTVGMVSVAWKASWDNEKVKWILCTGTFSIAMMILIPRYYYQIFQEEKREYYYNSNAADFMYLPENAKKAAYSERGEIIIVENEGVEFDWERRNGEIWIEIVENPYNNTRLEFPLYHYKGYVGVQKDGKHLIPTASENGLVCLDIEDYRGEMTIRYEETLCQKVSDIISLVTSLGLGISVMKRKIIYFLRANSQK